MNSDDVGLYEQTLSLYNDPDYAQKYAEGINDRMDYWMFDEFLPIVTPGGRILDVASAAGRDSAYIAEKGYVVSGIDQATKLVDIAKRNHPGIEFIVGDFTRLDIGDATFDGLWCKAALVHLPSQEKVEEAVREFYRVLKPGGAIMINTKAKVGDKPATTVRTDVLSGKKRYFRFQGEREFVQLMEHVGFKVANSKVYNEKEAQQYKNMRDEDWLFVLAKKPRKT